jgi:YVTN family beta-propeller protein
MFKVARALEDSLRQIDFTSESDSVAIRAVVTETDTVNGECGGSASYTISVDDQTGQFSGNFTYSSYCSLDVVISGSVSFSGQVNINTGDIESFSFSFSNLTVTSDGDSLTLDGDVSFEITGSQATITIDMLVKDNTTAKVYWLSDWTMTFTEEADHVVFQMSGHYYDPDHGYVIISTPVPFVVYYGEDGPREGQLVITGNTGIAGGSTMARLTALSPTTFQVEADTDGDGVYDWNSGPINWSGSAISLVYLPIIDGDRVIVIDMATNRVVNTVTTGNAPRGLDIIRALDRIYVADMTDDTLTVIDASDGTVVTTIDVVTPHGLGSVAVDDNNQIVYVLDYSNGTQGTNLHAFDAVNNTEIHNVTIGTQLQNMVVDPNANRAYATDFQDGVIVVNTMDHTVITTIDLPNFPHGIALNPDTNRLYVTQLATDTVEVIDTTTNTVVKTITVGAEPEFIGLDTIRDRAYVTNREAGTVSVIDMSNDTVVGTITVGTNPLVIAVIEYTARAYILNLGADMTSPADNTVSVIDTTTNTVVETIIP